MQHGKPDADDAKATAPALLTPLTKREQEVLGLMAFGLANKEIADRLSLSPRTVESHIGHVLGKLNTPTRARAVAEAGRAGLLGTTMSAGYSADYRPNNLPFQLTTLLGREQDLVDAKSLVAAHRLVTLSGSGGVGKTRLALRIGVDLLDLYPDGAWLCDFSPISDPVLVVSAVARALVVRERQSRPLLDSITEAVKRKRALLIFDNCEHVLDAAAEIVDEILHKCPNIRILATSRQALGIVGEAVYRVRSLSLPDSAEALKADKGLGYGAIALFVDRAQSSETHFAFTDENAPIVAEICQRLDGIPLAIELAATKSNVINLRTLARSLNDRFKVLTAGSRTALPRHKTLTALIDWSYDLLTRQEQILFNRVGIFSGGFSLAAATAVCSGDDLDEIDILELLVSLTDKSLVAADTRGEQERFRMLESTRAYALEKLAAEGECEQLTRRHAEYFRDQAQAMDGRTGKGSTASWLARVEVDLDNYRAALTWALIGGHDAVLGGALVGALESLWIEGGLTVEGRDWIGRAQAGVNDSVHPQVSARLWRAMARLFTGKLQHDYAQRALTLYEAIGDRRRAARALVQVASSLALMGRQNDAIEASSRALSVLRECDDKSGVATCLDEQGSMQLGLGNLAAARALYAQALSGFRNLQDEMGTARVLGNLAELEFADGNVAAALQRAEEALEIEARGKNMALLAIGNCNTAAYRLALGDMAGASTAARAGLAWSQRAQDTMQIAIALQHFALLHAQRGEFPTAGRLLGFVSRQFKAHALQRESTERWGYETLMTALREHLGEAEIERLAAEGAAWSEDQAVEDALKAF
jgi:predicted ATPase/DNA-binding CsgD family transcriptional regulator